MKKQETINIIKYLYYLESRLQADVDDYSYKFIRRELDEVDLLEEIIAKARLKLFYQIEEDLTKILKLSAEESNIDLDT